MAMYGWIASKDLGSLDTATKQSLKPFSQASGRGPFKFVVDTIADSNGADSKLHTVWIEIYDKETNEKKGELSVELSDTLDGISTSEDITLAMCLTKLGFVDDSNSLDTEGFTTDASQKLASRLGYAFKIASLRESMDSLLKG